MVNNFRGEDIKGLMFGKWLVLRYQGRRGWLCKCVCGSIKVLQKYTLTNGSSKSCGCGKNKGNTRHGKTGTRTFVSWNAMKGRCLNPNNGRYKTHGGRGITVCKRWMKFENFLADMGDRPEGTAIDRIDNNGNYTPKNCQWATPLEQSSNTRAAKFYTFNEITDTQAGWARRVGISSATLCKRLKRGWSLEKALSN